MSKFQRPSKPRTQVTFPEDQFTYEFRKIRGQKTVNPEMRRAIAIGPEKESDMIYGAASRDVGNIDARMVAHIEAAKNRQFTCRTPGCQSAGTPSAVDYKIIMHRKIVPHIYANSGSADDMMRAREQNEQMEAKFGIKTITCFHVGIYCKDCGKRIKFVKYNEANRRAANDFLLMSEETRGIAPDYLYR